VGNRAPVGPSQQALPFQQRQVSPHGRRRDSQPFGQVADPYAAARRKHLKDRAKALGLPHEQEV
jgi:hypothetical protein